MCLFDSGVPIAAVQSVFDLLVVQLFFSFLLFFTMISNPRAVNIILVCIPRYWKPRKILPPSILIKLEHVT